jgi:hypothetical protein
VLPTEHKDDLIYLVKLAYNLQGKGKTRKRVLPLSVQVRRRGLLPTEQSEILQIIEDKNSYFSKNSKN